MSCFKEHDFLRVGFDPGEIDTSYGAGLASLSATPRQAEGISCYYKICYGKE
jgi:hypothetical protein